MAWERTVDSFKNLHEEIMQNQSAQNKPPLPVKDLNRTWKSHALSRSLCLNLHRTTVIRLASYFVESKHFTWKFVAVPSCRLASEYTVKTLQISLVIVPRAVADAKHIFFSIELFNSCSVSSNVISVFENTFQICHICNCTIH